jgi:hypothetical protein
MATRNTRSALTDVNGNNRTATHLSTSIILKVDNYIIGAVQSLEITESRTITAVDEVGTDGHIDSAPTASTNITGRCERIRFDKQRIAEAFARGFVHVSSQRIPFDLEIHDRFHDFDEANEIVTIVKNVWISEISYGFRAKDWIISDNMSFMAERIYSLKNNGNVVTGVANGQDGGIYLNQFERENDRGGPMGSVSAPGLINALITDPTD